MLFHNHNPTWALDCFETPRIWDLTHCGEHTVLVLVVCVVFDAHTRTCGCWLPCDPIPFPAKTRGSRVSHVVALVPVLASVVILGVWGLGTHSGYLHHSLRSSLLGARCLGHSPRLPEPINGESRGTGAAY